MTTPERPPHNPYAPPAGPPEHAAPGVTARGVGQGWKWAYLVVSSLGVAGYAAVYWSATLGLTPGAIEVTRGLVPGLFVIVRGLVAVGWIQVAWASLPARWRREMTPNQAVFRLVVPVYGFYWSFAMNLLLCDRLDEGLRAGEDQRRAPRELAVAAAATSLGATVLGFVSGRVITTMPWLGMVSTGAASAGWCAYMFACDPVRARVAEIARGLPREADDAPLPTPISSIKLGCVLPLVFLLLMLVLAMWQFLAPSPRH